jgi:Holliday junction resolvasome RuvABC endonuclease subunit
MKPDTNTILALDPGLRDLGFAILKRGRLVAYGVRTLRPVSYSARIAEASSLVQTWADAHRPAMLVLEHTHGHPVNWFDAIDRLARSTMRVARKRDIEIARYYPQTVRRLIVGNGNATKQELAGALVLHFRQLRVYLTQDRKWKERHFGHMFDAVALALYHDLRKR